MAAAMGVPVEAAAAPAQPTGSGHGLAVACGAAAEQAAVETAAGNSGNGSSGVSSSNEGSNNQGQRGSKEEAAKVPEETKEEDNRFSRFRDLIFWKECV